MGSIPAKTFFTKKLDEIIIRTAEKNDAAEIIQLMNVVINEGSYTQAEPGEYKVTKSAEEEKILLFKKAHGKLLIVAAAGNTIAGFLEYSNWPFHRTQHKGFLSMFILKEYRDVGIGTMLLQCLIDWAEINDVIEKLTLTVFSTNERAIALYKKLGFEVEGVCPRDIKLSDGTYIDNIEMYKFVKRS